MPATDSSNGRNDALAGDRAKRAATPSWRVAVPLAVLVGIIGLLLGEGTISGSDGQATHAVARAIASGQGVAISPDLGMPGDHGVHVSRYGIGLSLLALPVELGARGVRLPPTFAKAAVTCLMPLVAGGLVAAVFLLGLALGAPAPSAALGGVTALAGTFVLPYAKDFFSEPLAALFVVLAVERAIRGRMAAAGLAVGLAGMTRPELLVLVPVMLVYALCRCGPRHSAMVGLAVLPGLLVVLAWNQARFGTPFRLGYEDVGFTTSFLEGAAGLFFHPDKSLLLFAPPVFLVPPALLYLWRRDRLDALLLVVPFAITFGMTATWFAWPGGWCWGPRLLIPGLMPLLAALAPWAATRGRRLSVVALAILGFVVSAPALIVNVRAQQLDVPPVSVGPGIVRQYALVAPTARYSLEHLFERGDGRHLRYLSLWQVGAARLYGLPGLAAALVVSGLLAGAGFAAWHRLDDALGGLDPVGVADPPS